MTRACVSVSAVLLCLAGVLPPSACGYHVGGRAARLPAGVQTIAVPMMANHTTSYRVEQRFTQATIREFLQRTRYRVIQNQNDADAVLQGDILSIETTPVLFDETSGRVTTALITIHTSVKLLDRGHHALYQNQNFIFRDEYQISTDVTSFFQEEDPSLERLARDFASHLVAAVEENF